MNRRTPTDSGYRNHPNPDGPVDHTVPVLRVGGADGELRAVVFGYACHNTTMGFLKWLAEPEGPAIWVAGYSNVYSGYIPSRRVLLEGGYEASSRPWKPTLEELIVGKVHALFDRLDSAP